MYYIFNSQCLYIYINIYILFLLNKNYFKIIKIVNKLNYNKQFNLLIIKL